MIEADEMWSFVGKKLVQVWVWAALDAGTRAVVAMATGDRSEATARELFEALPAEYRDGAIFLTDFWPAYRAALPDVHHREVSLLCKAATPISPPPYPSSKNARNLA